MDQSRKYLPLFFHLEGRPCLVVGGGDVARRKVQQLLQADAQVTVVSPQTVDELRALAENGKCRWLERDYISPEAQDYALVIAATSDPSVNQTTSDDCAKRGIPVNVVDQPQLCSVIFPAVVRRGPITAAISSGGAAPFFTRHLRCQLEELLAGLHQLEKPNLLLAFREFVRSQAENEMIKARLYERFLACDRPVWDLWLSEAAALKQWQLWLEEERRETG